MRNLLETTSFYLLKKNFAQKPFWDIEIRPNKKIIKNNEFKNIYLKSLNYFFSKINKKNSLFDSSDDLPCLYMSFYLNERDNWILFCEEKFLNLGLCSNRPINELTLELATLIDLVSLSGHNINILPIHINLSIYYYNNEHIHANTLVLDFVNKILYVFEPKGHIDNLFFHNNFYGYYKRILETLSQRLNWKYGGYLTPNFNYQFGDMHTCYLWTSWLEIIALINLRSSIAELRQYLKVNYKNNSFRNKQFKMGHYLLEVFLES